MNDKPSEIAMIITVGGTPQPIIKSIIEYKPVFVSFLPSQQSFEQVTDIKRQVKEVTGIEFQSEITIVDNVNDLYHCFKKAEEAVERVLKKGYSGKRVIVDYTGGTKNMSVALSLAAINNGFVFSYVGGKERTKNGVGVVVNGTEEVYTNINPWDFLGLEERKVMSILFNNYQFMAAKAVADSISQKSSKLKPIFQKISILIEGFYLWDMFRHKEAKDKFKSINLDDLVAIDDDNIRDFAQKAIKIIKKLDDILKKSYGGNKLCIELINDLFSNAERRFHEGKIDDAILRLYRIVEMTAQLRLIENFNIDTSDVKPDQIPEELRDEYLKSYKSESDGKIKIPLEASYRLLELLGDPYGKLFIQNKQRFQDIQTARNYSYLAHGFRSSSEKAYINLRNFLIELGMLNEENIISFPKLEC